MQETDNIYGVVIVDDHTLFRNGLRGLLDKSGACRVTAEASNGNEFIDILPSIGDDEVVLLDIDMPGMNGFEAAEKALAARPNLNIITLTMHSDAEYYHRMVAVGVKGFMMKDSEVGEVVEAIRSVAEGGNYFSAALLSAMHVTAVGVSSDERLSDEDELSQRELEILPLICQGLSNHEIADKLFISKRTVDKHRANILAKTGCKNTANLVVHAIKNHLVEL